MRRVRRRSSHLLSLHADAWHYRTQLTDPTFGSGIHDVWFIFSGVKLEKLLFQAFPISEYDAKYGVVFDQIVSTYHTVPRV